MDVEWTCMRLWGGGIEGEHIVLAITCGTTIHSSGLRQYSKMHSVFAL
jgi:hypothetical protein